MTPSSWWTTATPPAFSARPAAARRNTMGVLAAHRHHHQHARQNAGRSGRRLHLRHARKSSIICGNGRGPIYSPTRCRRRSSAPRSRRSSWSRAATSCAIACTATPVGYGRHWKKRVSRLKPGQHPILPVMLGDAALATTMADKLLERGIYVIGFSFPVVPQGQARIRIQLSAAHTQEQLEQAAKAFADVRGG